MPNILLNDRIKFRVPVTDVLSVLNDDTDSIYVKGEYFGYFVNRVCKRYQAAPDYVQESFNSRHFNDAKKKALANAADSIAAVVNRSDPITAAGELNYAISAVLWGFLGDADGFSPASYGMWAYLRAMIERVLSTMETVNSGSQRDNAMAFRRHLVIRGVLADIVSETYRRRIGPSESGPEAAASPIWLTGELVIPAEAK